MDMDYTQKQADAVNAVGETLVTAAAGSGKTSVLTSRVVKIIREGGDIRDMMIATFTNAAAEEMKSRIAESLSKHSADGKMRRQAELVSCAHIGTYHSFCIRTLRENYLDARLPYNFRVMDPKKSDNFKNRTVNDYLSSCIENGDEEVCRFIEKFSNRFNKKNIAALIIRTYDFMVKTVNPDLWLEASSEMSYDRYCELCGGESDAVKQEYESTMPDVRMLVRMTREFSALYNAGKADEAMLDFDDLLHRTYELLQHKKIKYKYVFVDEYQDTNPIQDAIIRSITDADIFIVGDKKQSIYRFNYADPRIFIDREKKIGDRCHVMNENFRSSAAVINAVNFVMSQVMTPATGQINYTGDEELACKSEADGGVSLLLHEADKSSSNVELRGKAEAVMIASVISRMLGTEYSDGENKRTLTPGDFAVLYRSNNHVIPNLCTELEGLNIPYNIVGEEKGRASVCADLFMDILKVVCSPERDIPLLAVMRYPGIGFRDSEFATVRKCFPGSKNNELPFSEACRRYADAKKDRLAVKISALFDKLEKLRLYFDSYSLADFLYFSAQEFSLFDYALMKSRAEYKALFSLMNTIVSCGEYSLPMILKYMEDFRSEHKHYAGISAERNDEAVSVMTIHRSKGLEFPVVIVCNIDKNFSSDDYSTKNLFMLNSEYGIMPVIPKIKNGVRKNEKSSIWQACEQALHKEDRAEEIRLLYVAMTRAKNFLFLTSVYKKNSRKPPEDIQKALASSGCLLDIVLAATRKEGALRREYFSFENNKAQNYTGPCVTKQEDCTDRQWIIFDDPDMTRAAYSVSEIKKDESGLYFVPEMFDDSENVTGADLGTVIHSIMEKSIESGNPGQTVQDMADSLIITTEEKKAADDFMENIKGFFASDIYERIRKSSRVLTEQPFLVKRDASDFGKGSGTTMLHGVIDLAFEEDGEWVVLDYKTDRITESNEQRLIDNYSLQLEMYADALSELTGMKTKEKVLYFLRTGKAYTV